MKTIKINFCNTSGNEFNAKQNLVLSILQRHFDVQISDNPDFVIVGNDGLVLDFIKYDCVRIMLATENFSPDFTLFDYWIGFDDLQFGDRYFEMPLSFQSADGSAWTPIALDRNAAKKLLNSKDLFCNFIYRHESATGVREKLFDKLNSYKKVTSPGNYLNNMSGEIKSYTELNMKRLCSIQEKMQYLSKSKFTIACDSVSYPGFVTEKIVDAFKAHSIPIYCGSPNICKYFNEKSFILCRSIDDVNDTIEKVKFLDSHDDAYLDMLTESPLKYPSLISDKYKLLETFLLNIFNQTPEEAKRRPDYFLVSRYTNYLRLSRSFAEKHEKPARKKLRQLKRKIKKMVGFHQK